MNAERELLTKTPIAIMRERRPVPIESHAVELTVSAFEQEGALRIF